MKKMDQNVLIIAIGLLVIIVLFGLIKFFFNNVFDMQVFLDFEWIPTLIIALIGIFLGYLLVGRRLSSTTVPIRLSDPVIRSTSGSRNNRLENSPYRKFHYLEEYQLGEIGEGMALDQVQLLITVVGSIMTMAIIASAIFLATPTGNEFYKSFLSNFMNFLVGFILLLFGYLISYTWKKKLANEVKTLLFSKRAIVSFSVGIIIYSIFSILAIRNGSVAWDGILFGFALLLPFLLVAQLGGKYFLLFAVHQWHQLWNWDLLKGEKVVPGRGFKSHTKRWIIGIIAFIGIISLPIGLIGSLINIIEILQNPAPQTNNSLLQGVITSLPGPLSFYLLILGLGPLLSLFLRPLSYVEIWVHQGLYDRLGSKWANDPIMRAINKSDQVVQLPRITPTLSMNMFIITGFILLLIGAEALAPVVSSTSPFISQAIWLAGGASDVVFLLNVIFLFQNIHELNALNLFAIYGRKYNRNLVNEIFFAEDIVMNENSVQCISKLKEWSNASPNWGIPYYELGNAYSRILQNTKNLQEQVKTDLITKAIEAYTISLNLKLTLTKDMQSWAIKNLGLLKKGII